MTFAQMTFARSLLLIAFLATPAQAADVVYPAGSRIGLAPPPGMTVSKNFSGFEDRDKRVALVIVALPAAAYPEIEQSTTAELAVEAGRDPRNARGRHASARQGVPHCRASADRGSAHPQMDSGGVGWRPHRAGHRAGAGGRAAGLCRRNDPHRADDGVGAAERADRGAVEPAAVPGERACRLQDRRRHRRPRRHADRRRARAARQGHRHPHPGRHCRGRAGAGRRSRPLCA